MSRRKDNARRRQKRENRRREKKAARQKRNTIRQTKTLANKTNKPISNRVPHETVGIKAGNSGGNATPTRHHRSRACRFLELMIVVLYVGLGCLYLWTEVNHTTIGCTYCVIGFIHATIHVIEGIL